MVSTPQYLKKHEKELWLGVQICRNFQQIPHDKITEEQKRSLKIVVARLKIIRPLIDMRKIIKRVH